MKYLVLLITAILLFISNSNTLAISSPDSTNNDLAEKFDPKIILEKYLDAIGGRDALLKIDDRTTIMRGTAMGQPLTIIVKQKAPNKMKQDLKFAGMDQTIVFDGEKGVMKSNDKTVEVTGKELEQLKTEASMELLLDPESFGITLAYEGTEKVEDKDTYKIKITLPSGIRWYSFFDAETGLKLKEQKEMQTQMGLVEQVVTYDDYTEVDGIKYPFKLTQSFGPQSVEMTVSSVKVNKGLGDDIFVVAE
jgi:outer membrane lipoprotein-sorting protein